MGKAVNIDLGSHNFPYYFDDTLCDTWLERVASLGADRAFIICDTTVAKLYGDEICAKLNKSVLAHLVVHPVGELGKRLSIVESCLTNIISNGASRRSIVVALGGGVTGNIAGLVAGLCFRGIRLVHIPTTLMAFLDSIISLKQGVNSDLGKNHIGCYLKPEFVLADTRFLSTLASAHLRSGVCEVIKNTLAIDPSFADELLAILKEDSSYSPAELELLIERGVSLKVRNLRTDPYERKDGIVFEYGHTVGHAIEYCAQGTITHGDCVGLGLICAAHIARELLGLPREMIELHHTLLQRAGAPACIPSGINVNALIERIKMDNKRGYLNVAPHDAAMVLLTSLGQPAREGGYPLIRTPLSLIEKSLACIF